MKKISRIPKTIFIAGYYGYDIIGDDSILESILYQLRNALPLVDFIVTSANPAGTKAAYGVNAVGFEDMAAIIEGMRKSDLVLVGGGAVFNEYFPVRTEGFLTQHADFNVFCASVPLLARALHKPCFLYAVGVEPLYSNEAKQMVRAAFELTTSAFVRDPGSLEVLNSIGIQRKDIKVTVDPAVRLPVQIGRNWKTAYPDAFSMDKPFVGVSLRHWTERRTHLDFVENDWEGKVAAALDQFCEKTGANVLFVPFQNSPQYGVYADDIPVFYRVQSRMKHADQAFIPHRRMNSSEIAACIAGSNLFICTRFHSVILSVSAATPCLAISYSLKVKSAMDMAGMGTFTTDMTAVETDWLTTHLMELYENQERYKKALIEVSEAWKEKEHENTLEAVRLLDAPDVIPSLTSFEQELSNQLLTQIITANRVDRQNEIMKKQLKAFNFLLHDLVDEKEASTSVEETLERLLETDHSNGEWHYLAGTSYLRNDRSLDLAEHHFDEALKNGFDPFAVYFNRGLVRFKRENVEGARADLEQARSVDSSRKEVQQQLAVINQFELDRWIRMAKAANSAGNLGEAYALLSRCLSKKINHAEAHFLMGLWKQDDIEKKDDVLTHFDTALKNQYDEFEVRYQRGAYLHKVGDRKKALVDLQKAAELRPEHEGVIKALQALKN